MSWSPNQKTPIKFHLCLELFLFLFLLFQAEHLNIMAITTINMIFICSTTWNCATYLMFTRANRLAHRVSSIHQNQTRVFNHSAKRTTHPIIEQLPSSSPDDLHAQPLPGAPLSTKYSRQSTEGYTHGSIWLVEVRVIGTGWWHGESSSLILVN